MNTATLQFDRRTLHRLGLKLPQQHEEALLRLLQNELDTRRTEDTREALFDAICEEVCQYREEILSISGTPPSLSFRPEDVQLGAVLPFGRYPQSRSAPTPTHTTRSTLSGMVTVRFLLSVIVRVPAVSPVLVFPPQAVQASSIRTASTSAAPSIQSCGFFNLTDLINITLPLSERSSSGASIAL